MEKLREVVADKLGSENTVVKSILAEFIGTFFLLLIGLSANIQQATTNARSETSLQFAWGFGFAFAVYLSASVSGGHLNPAISLSSLIVGDISGVRFVVYVLAQLLGAFVGSAAAYLGHIDDINYLDNGEKSIMGGNATASLFTTFPSTHISAWGSFIDQVMGTAILALCIALITDKRHQIPTGIVPLLAGFTMSMISMTYGTNGGFAINPARDLSPRLFLLCVGYGWSLFTVKNYYWWIPVVAPCIGAILGTWIYKIFVGIHGGSDEIDITTDTKLFYGRGEPGYKRHLSRDNEKGEPDPLHWRQNQMTVPEFFPGSSEKKALETQQHPISSPSSNFYHPRAQQPAHSTVLTARDSFRREPDPSPPPPLPSSQPPATTTPQQPTFVDELKQRNIRQQRQPDSSDLTKSQDEQTVSLFAEPNSYPKKANGPIKSEKLFGDLFTPPPKRQIYPKQQDSDDSDEPRGSQPKAPPRRLQPDRPEVTDKITVSLAYYQDRYQAEHRHPNDEIYEKPKILV